MAKTRQQKEEAKDILVNNLRAAKSVVFASYQGLKVKETEPGVKGNTATGGRKPATMETGIVVQVPLFINEGDSIRINTETGEYVERA